MIDTHLPTGCYVIADSYTIVDMVIWGSARLVLFILGDTAENRFRNLKHWHGEIAARPVAIRAIALADERIPSAAMDNKTCTRDAPVQVFSGGHAGSYTISGMGLQCAPTMTLPGCFGLPLRLGHTMPPTRLPLARSRSGYCP